MDCGSLVGGSSALAKMQERETDVFSLDLNNTCVFSANETGNLTAAKSTISIALLSIFLGSMTICSAVGNVLVILSVALTRKLRTVTNCFIVSLAVADLLVAVFVMPISAFVEVTSQWWFGPLVCWIFISADVFLCTSSIWNLLIISFERCMAISWPLWYGARRTKRLAVYLIAVAWAVSLVICMPPLILQGILEGATVDGQCSYAIDGGYRIYSACGSFWIPLSIILFCYVRIFYVTQRKDKLLQGKKSLTRQTTVIRNGRPPILSNPSTSSAELQEMVSPLAGFINLQNTVFVRGASSITETNINSSTALVEIHLDESFDRSCSLNSTIPNGSAVTRTKSTTTEAQNRRIRRGTRVGNGHLGSSSMKQSFKDRERKVFKVLLIILCSFVACWMGFFVIYTLEPFCAACKDIDKRVYDFFLWLGYFNSMLNPLIYAGFSKEFRTAFLSILGCKCFWESSNNKASKRFRQATVGQ